MSACADQLLFGPYGADALEHAGTLAEFGANAVWFHGFNEKAFAACDCHHLAACVEFKTFRADFNRHPELIPIGVDGKPIRVGKLVQGVCLSNQSFLDEIEFSLAEGLKQFQPRGIWLDYLTYAGWFETPDPDLQDSCFCQACITDFCETQHLDADHPSIILQKHAALWHRHKCEKIARFAARYAGLIHARQPDCIIGAYMCPWEPHEHDRAITRIFGQDVNLLADAIDVFTPLIYTTKSGRASDWGREYLEKSADWIPAGKKIQLILDALDFPQSLEAAAASRIPSWGIQVFAGGSIFADRSRAELFRQAVTKIRQ
ncbi:MAG: hypothetical protein SCM11_02080 [Bacillota bacterium]|nr:hypothetical protein [Bacillota bacterium]